jgi:TolB protein
MISTASMLRLCCGMLAVAPAGHAQRTLQPGQVAQLRTIGIDGAAPMFVFETQELIQAPNWTPDGKWLVCNSGGGLVKIAADGSRRQEKIFTGTVRAVNNDHVLSPDGRTIYFSASGRLWAVPFAGGEPRQISNEPAPEQRYRCALHGISPDGRMLTYVRVIETGRADLIGRADIYAIPSAGGADMQLTDTAVPDDGPEYSPDGKWIYFNSELNAKDAGHAQIYRMKPDGTGIEQLTHDERVNWFPHVSPDGQWVLYLSFPPGTVKHPADKDVILRRMRPDGSAQTGVVACFGGQGTINVNSWAPDSRRFAYVTFPIHGTSTMPATKRTQEASTLSSPWQHADIGPVTIAGMASATEGTFALSGTLDIYGKSDGCHFAWQTLHGDGAIIARVLSIEQTHYHAKGGLAMRESLSADARHATWVATPADGAQLLVREQPATATTARKKADMTKIALPVWLKLVREGDVFTASHSADGKAWTQMDSVTIRLSESLHVGLVASSHQKDKLGTAAFDSVKVIKSGEQER